jgi:AcrR family transcriptional regulator
MSRAADPTVRAALVETAAQILATDGPGKLTLRRLTRDVGTSTMAVYTHFGGMEQLRIAICTEGFRRLGAHLGSVPRTDDPVADLVALGAAYVTNARENPNLYRAMFLDRLPGLAPMTAGSTPAPGSAARPDTAAPAGGDTSGDDALVELTTEGLATFTALLDTVRRCVASGRFTDDDPERLATELWGALHGVVALELAGMLDVARASDVLRSATRHLLVGFASEPADVEASFDAGIASLPGA